MKLTKDFFNKVLTELDAKYFPAVKYYGDDKNDSKLHYAVECFSNGVLTYPKLIDKAAKLCKDSTSNIHAIVSKYVEDFGGYEYKPKVDNKVCHFYPLKDKDKWTSIEVQPVKETKTDCMICEPSQAQFWSVYVRLNDGTALCVADIPNESTAKSFQELLLTMIKTYKSKK